MLAKLLAQAQDEWQLFDQPQRPRILLGAGTCGRAAGLESVAERTAPSQPRTDL